MGFDRGALNAVLLATTAGFTIGGAIGVVSPTFAEAGPSAPRSRPPATVVTDVDVLGADHMTISIRFSNTGPSVRHVAATDVSVSRGFRGSSRSRGFWCFRASRRTRSARRLSLMFLRLVLLLFFGCLVRCWRSDVVASGLRDRLMIEWRNPAIGATGSAF